MGSNVSQRIHHVDDRALQGSRLCLDVDASEVARGRSPNKIRASPFGNYGLTLRICHKAACVGASQPRPGSMIARSTARRPGRIFQYRKCHLATIGVTVVNRNHYRMRLNLLTLEQRPIERRQWNHVKPVLENFHLGIEDARITTVCPETVVHQNARQTARQALRHAICAHGSDFVD